MTAVGVVWAYSLAPDIEIVPGEGGVFLRTATTKSWLDEDGGDLSLLPLLIGDGASERTLAQHLESRCGADVAAESCAALLFRLDQLGVLTRTVVVDGHGVVSCIPGRAPREDMPELSLAKTFRKTFRLSANAIAHTDNGTLILEQPGGWAKIAVHDRGVASLLIDLARGADASELQSASDLSVDALQSVLALMMWCGLLDRDDDDAWSTHDLLFHTQTRQGYARIPLGKTYPGGETVIGSQNVPERQGVRIVLEQPDPDTLRQHDPTYALVTDRRKSTRRFGPASLTAQQLSEFLFRALFDRNGRRPYPSAGGLYPLTAYLAINRCEGIAPALYAYDAQQHELVAISQDLPAIQVLLRDAAAAANVDEMPHILMVLAARYTRTRAVYGDLSYSLILKEVGAVMQTAMLAAAAMHLGVCPLGRGDSVAFADLIGADGLHEASVGEMMLGSLPNA